MKVENVIIALVLFVIATVVSFIVNGYKISVLTKKKRKKKTIIVELRYLELTSNLVYEKLLVPNVVFMVSLINAFIITLTFLVVTILPVPIIFQLVIGFALLFGLIYSIYGIYGKLLILKGYDKK